MRDILSGIQRKPDESDIIEPMNDVTAEAEEAAEEVVEAPAEVAETVEAPVADSKENRAE